MAASVIQLATSSVANGIAGKGVMRAGRVPLYSLTNIKNTKYFNSEPRFNGIFSRDNLPRIEF